MYKLFFVWCVALSIQFTGIKHDVTAHQPKPLMPLRDSAAAIPVSLAGNGYFFPRTGGDQSNIIDVEGLTRWRNKAAVVKVFFFPQHTGKISVSARLKQIEGESVVAFRLDGTGKAYQMAVKNSNDYQTLPVGEFDISDNRYHYIEIKAISKSGKYFPMIRELLFSGPASENLKYNLSLYRGAASTHLRFRVPGDSTAAWFYTEVRVPKGVDAINAYYETNGFSDGYMGLQINSPVERRIIFSIWSNFNTDDPKLIPKEYAVTLLKKGEGVYADQFGNEGSGGHSHLIFDWKGGSDYKLLVGASPSGDHTVFSAYYYAPENKAWKFIVRWDKSKTGGRLLRQLYAFVENFGDNGSDFFKAFYGNQWICTPSGHWIELTRCYFTTTANPGVHQRYDYGAGVEHNWFYLYTGGFMEPSNINPGQELQRIATGVRPSIDFSALPDH